MSFVSELKRRNVFRVGAAYLISAWLLMQVTDLLAQMLELPVWVPKFILLLLLVGLIPALVIAWAFELTPEGLRREKDVNQAESVTQQTGQKLNFIIIGALVLALGGVIWTNYFRASNVDADRIDRPQQNAPEAHVDNSIAVLPFVNMSSDPEQEFFSDGLSEEILNLLANVPDLVVIGRTSSFSFKGKNEDLRTIGKTLGVSTVLEGSVRKSGNRLRITAQLIDVSTGAHLWSDTYDRTMTDIFEVQDSVASSILNALRIRVEANPTRGRPTENNEAYTLFLKARAAMSNWRTVEATTMLKAAIEIDPNFAEAYELLAYVYWTQYGISLEPTRARALINDTVKKALAVNPDLVFARGLARATSGGTFFETIAGFEQAARLQPSNTGILDALTYLLIEFGYVNEAVARAEKFVELDPLSPLAHSRLSQALQGTGRPVESLEAVERAIQLGADYALCIREMLFVIGGRDEDAIATLEEWLNRLHLNSGWVRDFIISGRDPVTGTAYLDKQIPQIVASIPEEFRQEVWRVLINHYGYFRHFDRQFEIIIENAVDATGWTLADDMIFEGTITHNPGFTAHPKYLEVAELIPIIDLWEQRGPPDFCAKISGQWVCR